MTVNHRKKNSRQRGSFTHGWGEKKKHRGAGHRGGRGNAGSGKRGDAKKPSYWKIKNFSGKHGFTNPTTKTEQIMSLEQLNVAVDKLVAAGNAVKEADAYKVNLSALGVHKLLGTGLAEHKYELVVAKATPGAIKKVEALGGSLVLGSSE
jgi:large subunit ribosomal protein L15